MRIRLTAGTDIALFIIFDPGSIPAGVVDSRNPLDAIDKLTSSGQAICYSFCSDGDTDFLILVDESPEVEFLDRRSGIVDNILLHVPTGRIVATGFEDLCGNYDPNSFTPKSGDAAEIPAGSYTVTAFDLDWGDEVEQAISQRAVPGDETFETIVGTSLGCATLFTIGSIMAAIGQWNRPNARYALLICVVYWLIAIPIVRYSKRWRRMQELRKHVNIQYPDNILVFRTLDEPTSSHRFNVGKFGTGFAADDA